MNEEVEEFFPKYARSAIYQARTFEDFIRKVKIADNQGASDRTLLEAIVDELRKRIVLWFPELHNYGFHRPLVRNWEAVEQVLRYELPPELFADLQYSLLHGFYPRNVPKAPNGQDKSPPYTYHGLGKDEIRLLVLHPAKDTTKTILCTLCHEKLTPNVYEALSYVWGDPMTLRRIKVNHTDMLVTENLEEALRALRDVTEPRVLWVDALCINQQNSKEKSIQIQMMAKIYSLARQVVVWVGTASDSSAVALSLLSDLGSSLREDALDHNNPDPRPRDMSSQTAGHAPHIAARRQDICDKWSSFFRDRSNQRFLEALRIFFQRPWWRRIWIFQELVLAKAAILVCGRTIMPWDDFHRAVGVAAVFCMDEAKLILDEKGLYHQWGQRVKLLKDIQALVWPVGMMQVYRQKRASNAVISLEALLHNTVKYQATDARDKVYAVLGLVNDDPGISSAMTPVYDISTDSLYRKVAMYVIKHRGDLAILEHGDSNFGRCCKNGVLCLESWVLDFSDKADDRPIDRDAIMPEVDDMRDIYITIVEGNRPGPMIFERQFQAGTIGDKTSPLAVSFSDDLRTLTVTGIEIDSISDILPICLPRLAEVEQCLRYWHKDFHDRMANRPKSSPYPPDTDTNDMFWRIVLANRWHTRDTAIMRPINSSKLDGYGRFPPQTIEEQDRFFKEIAKQVAYRTVLCAARKMFWTSKGYVGLGPTYLAKGDIVAVLLGANVPMCLRMGEGVQGECRVVGDCYIHSDVMHGKAVLAQQKGEGGYELKQYKLQ
ncbi:heterokaryon incompatibility protein-domain-containing protein [Paraphoma chrysanthemicola]|uniref:Heterokaryon incompatibility protein-domain-containing protein n=1 Tax=Paraphoma chrysanthemicola TaxID=798071 RepID=A0A8K0R3R1_9PLEO|nr:heterokaryon incompatibility protein-domain-containing protein [Paraphoma chrysanthemicola]